MRQNRLLWSGRAIDTPFRPSKISNGDAVPPQGEGADDGDGEHARELYDHHHGERLLVVHPQEPQRVNRTDEESARDPREAGHNDEKTEKHDEKDVVGRPQHYSEGEAGPEKMCDGDQLDEDTREHDTDASPRCSRPHDAFGESARDTIDSAGNAIRQPLREAHPAAIWPCNPPLVPGQKVEKRRKQNEIADTTHNEPEADVARRVRKDRIGQRDYDESNENHAIDEAILLGDEVVVMTARPGRIKEVIKIDLPRPRSQELINTPEFGDLYDRILHLIREEVLNAMQQQNEAAEQ